MVLLVCFCISRIVRIGQAGVEMATASFKEGRVTALINPEKIDRVELETALKQRGVQLKME